MRVSTAFNRLLGLPGASVRVVRFDAEGVVVTVALRRRRRICSGCGQVCRATHDTVRSAASGSSRSRGRARVAASRASLRT